MNIYKHNMQFYIIKDRRKVCQGVRNKISIEKNTQAIKFLTWPIKLGDGKKNFPRGK